jgi:hypothetical protein
MVLLLSLPTLNQEYRQRSVLWKVRNYPEKHDDLSHLLCCYGVLLQAGLHFQEHALASQNREGDAVELQSTDAGGAKTVIFLVGFHRQSKQHGSQFISLTSAEGLFLAPTALTEGG